MKTLKIELPQSGEKKTIPVATSADAWSWPKTRDLIQGAISAGISSALGVLLPSLEDGQMVFNWKIIAGAAIAGFVTYFLRKLPQQKVIVINPKELLP